MLLCYVSFLHAHTLTISLFQIPIFIIPCVNDCEYKSIVISDHALLLFNYTIIAANRGHPVWRLNPRWLHDKNFLEFVGINIDTYFQLNLDQTSASTRWEAFKAFIQG